MEAKEGQVFNTYSTCATFRSKIKKKLKKNVLGNNQFAALFAEHHSNITEIIQRVSHPHSQAMEAGQSNRQYTTFISLHFRATAEHRNV